MTANIVSPSIPEMYAEWLAIRHKPRGERTDAELNEEPSRYQVLQEAILRADPQTPQDVAMMFIADTDDGDSYHSDVFDARIRELVSGQASKPDPLLELINQYRAGVVAWNAIPAETITKENEAELTAATYGKFQDALSEGPPAATSLAGVRAALQLAIDEDGFGNTIAEGAVRAALAFFDGRTAA